MNIKLNEVLFEAGKKFSLIPSLKTGMKVSDDAAKAASHKGRAHATLSNAVFTVKALMLDEVALAYSEDSECLYGEFDHTNQDKTVSHYKFLYHGASESVEYEGDAPEEGSPYSILPVVCYQACVNREIGEALVEAIRGIKGHDVEAPTYCFKFCDAFYYAYAKTDPTIMVSPSSLSLESVKTAYDMGNLTDLSATAPELNTKPCDLFMEATKKKEKAEKKKKAKKNEWKEMLKDIKAGKYLIGYDWSEEQLRHVPPMSYLDTFIPSEEFYEILRKLSYRLGDHMVSACVLEQTEPDDIKNDIVNILLYGDPGSGKTALVHALAAATGMPLYSIKFNEDSEDDVFEGKNKIVEGKISFVETEFLKGFEKGGIVLMEEINLGRANMLTSVMNQAMEYPFYVERNGYDKVVRHPLVAAFATMNLDTDGTMTLNSAMAQRFNNKYMVDEPSESEFKERLVALGFNKDRVDYVYGVYNKIRTYLKETEARSKYLKELSIRQCIAALQDMDEGSEARRAVYNTMFGAICIKNRKLAETIKASILETYPDYMGE